MHPLFGKTKFINFLIFTFSTGLNLNCSERLQIQPGTRKSDTSNPAERKECVCLPDIHLTSIQIQSDRFQRQ